MSVLTFGRREASPPAARRTREGMRVVRLVVAATALHRALTLTTVLAGGVGLTTVSMAVAYPVVAVWGGALLWDGWRRGAFQPRLACVDVVLACAVGLLALTWGPPGMRFEYQVLQGAAIVAGCALPPRALAVAVSALVGVKFLATAAPPEPERITQAEFLVYAATLVGIALAASGAHRLLRLAADAVDRRATAPVPDRVEHQRVLHDTALATLTAIATGVLDARATDVRARCARDAAYLRLIMQGGRLTSGSLPVELAAATTEAAAVGLRVHPRCDTLPTDLDPPVVTAIAMAVREALNNAHRHAGTDQAWLSAAQEGRHVVVRVVDRGVGFTPDRHGTGRGITESISARLREVGGDARIESAPGSGTCVELRWPR